MVKANKVYFIVVLHVVDIKLQNILEAYSYLFFKYKIYKHEINMNEWACIRKVNID